MWCCPNSGEPLDPISLETADGHRYPRLDGVPVLMADPERFLARHGPGWAPGTGLATLEPDPLPVDAPDPLTPHLPLSGLGAPGGLGAWLAGVGDGGPDAVCARFGADLAPEGPSADLGCGVGPMTRRMAVQGRQVWACDRSPRAVLLARDLLTGRLPEVGVLTGRATVRMRPWPYPPLSEERLNFAIADALAPPFDVSSFAWVHLGNLVDISDSDPLDLLETAAALLVPGGLLTLSTPHDVDLAPTDAPSHPAEELRELLGHAGLFVVDEVDHVPWVVRQYDRGYRVLFTQCLAARLPLNAGD